MPSASHSSRMALVASSDEKPSRISSCLSSYRRACRPRIVACSFVMASSLSFLTLRFSLTTFLSLCPRDMAAMRVAAAVSSAVISAIAAQPLDEGRVRVVEWPRSTLVVS